MKPLLKPQKADGDESMPSAPPQILFINTGPSQKGGVFWQTRANGYNSNSYVHGLIIISGGQPPVDFSEYVGGAKPVPEEHFQP